jgi:hypothetical protein
LKLFYIFIVSENKINCYVSWDLQINADNLVEWRSTRTISRLQAEASDFGWREGNDTSYLTRRLLYSHGVKWHCK